MALILNITDGKVTFIARDYRDRAIKKSVTLDGIEFLRRFPLHIMPKRFVKIRRYGIYTHTTKRNLNLQFVTEEKPDIETLIKQKQPPETNLQRLKGSPVLIHVNARYVSPDRWWSERYCPGYGHRDYLPGTRNKLNKPSFQSGD